MTAKAQYSDLIVIGPGRAGQHGAVQAVEFKKSVLVVERRRRSGGVCVLTGTTAPKTLRETVLNLSGLARVLDIIPCSALPAWHGIRTATDDK